MSSLDDMVNQLNHERANKQDEAPPKPAAPENSDPEAGARASAALKDFFQQTAIQRPQATAVVDTGESTQRRQALEQFVGASFGSTTVSSPGAAQQAAPSHAPSMHTASPASSGPGQASSLAANVVAGNGDGHINGHLPANQDNSAGAATNGGALDGNRLSADNLQASPGGPAPYLCQCGGLRPADSAPPPPAPEPVAPPPPEPVAPPAEMNTPTAAAESFVWKKHISTVESALRAKDLKIAEGLLTILTELADILPIELTVRLRLLTQLATIRIENGQVPQAQADLIKALQSVDGTASKKSIATAYCLDALAQCYQLQENFEQSEKARRTAVVIADDCVGMEHPDSNYFRERLEAARQERQIAQIGTDEASRTLLDKLTDEYNALVAAGQTPEVSEPKPGDSTSGFMFEKYLQNGKNAITQKNPREAESALRSAVDKAQGLPENDPRRCEGLRLLATVVDQQGKQQEAKELYETALTMAFKHIGWADLEVAHALSALADLHNKLGDIGLAKNYYRQAIGIYSIKLGKDHETTAALQAAHDAFMERVKEERKWKGWSA